MFKNRFSSNNTYFNILPQDLDVMISNFFTFCECRLSDCDCNDNNVLLLKYGKQFKFSYTPFKNGEMNISTTHTSYNINIKDFRHMPMNDVKTIIALYYRVSNYIKDGGGYSYLTSLIDVEYKKPTLHINFQSNMYHIDIPCACCLHIIEDQLRKYITMFNYFYSMLQSASMSDDDYE